MSERRRILLSSVVVMVAVSVSAAGLAIYVLYGASFEQQRARLSEVAMSRARIIEAVARFDSRFSQDDVPGGARAATLDQIVDAHENFEGFGETGEFTLARSDGDRIVFLISHRHGDLEALQQIPITSRLAEPMRRALRGESGTVVGLDYRGATVLAAYETLPELGWGVVAKIDMDEINSPFVRAAQLVGVMALLVIAVGVGFVLRLTSPLIRRLEARSEELREAQGLLEARVEERTSELSKSNAALRREIGERQQAERALRESTARSAGIVEAAFDGIITIDETGSVESVNPGAVGIFGYPEKELIGSSVSQLLPPAYRDDHDGHIARYLATGERTVIGTAREGFGLRKDGSTFPMELLVAEVDLGHRRIFAWTIRDLTERKQMEEQLLQAQKMEAVGELAGGVAHDFNNLLGSIQGSGELIVDRTGDDGVVSRAANRIQHAVDRGTRLTKQLLAFSRKEVVRPEVVNPNSHVTELSGLFTRLIGEDVEVKLDLDPTLGRVEIDPGQFDQVVMNLVLNARDAMTHGGQLSVKTYNVDLPDFRADQAGIPACNYLVVEVADTGVGMATETVSRIFDPFFTTKEPGKGTGLGLSTVYGIVKDAAGRIEVESKPGRGSTFSVYLPRVEKDIDRTSVESPRAVPEGGSESILIVEDDDLVLELASEVLEMYGYSVIDTGTPEEAIRVVIHSETRIDLLLSDIVMPQMSGLDLVERLRSERPGLNVLFMSGYADGALARRGVLGREEAFIRKPFSNTALASKVREVLDSRARGGHD